MKKLLPVLLLFVIACKHKDYNADLLVKNAVVYTVDSNFTTADAFVVNAGKIVAGGQSRYFRAKVYSTRGN
jgi:predicted amidohydrolase YtcJ